MAAVRNRVVKNKKKRVAPKVRSAGSAKRGKSALDARVVGWNLPKFSDDILAERHARGMTQREVGAATGMTSAAVVFIENGKSNPLVGNFAKLCQFFKLDPAKYIPVQK